MSATPRRLKAAAFALASVVAAVVMTGSPAQATNIGNEGCTPGYWKNHTDNWEEYTTASTIADQHWLDGASTTLKNKYNPWTFLDALQGGGGSGVDGAAKILLRASTAAYLNAAHEGLGYPYRRFNDPGQLKTTIQAAFASGDRDTMLALATMLDDANNLGCPLN